MFYHKLKNKLKLKHTHNLSWRSFLACLGSKGKCLGKGTFTEALALPKCLGDRSAHL